MKRIHLGLLLLALAAGAATAAVFVLRLRSAEITAHRAPVTQTTGCEEESVFAVWRAVHHHPVYANTAKLPFASAYFNWLFYHGYGAVLRPGLELPGDEALPLHARRLTLAGALLGAALTAGLLVKIAQGLPLGARGVAAVLGASVFVGILPSWWALTVRPDVWALAFEAAGVTWLLLGSRRVPFVAVLGAALLFFAAWSCKQTFVTGVTATVVFLLLRRRWRDAALVVAVFAALVGAVLLTLGADYRRALTETVAATGFNLHDGLRIAAGAGLKMLPGIVAVPAILVAFRRELVRRDDRSLASDALWLGLIGTAVGIVIAAPASFRGGAATNYYFPPYLMLAIAGVAAATLLREARLLALAGVLLTVLPVAVLLGRGGVVSLAPGTAEILQRWSVWKEQPEPRFSADLRLNLPWLSSASPPLVLAFNYPFDRARGRVFEAGGVGGLIDRGYFASLLLPSDAADGFDGARLRNYRRVRDLTGMVLYRRIDPNDSAKSDGP